VLLTTWLCSASVGLTGGTCPVSNPYQTCQVCKKSRPQNSFYEEFNPKGKYFSCRTCVAKNKIYCPIHETIHKKAEVLSAKFSFGDECPLVTAATAHVSEKAVSKVPEIDNAFSRALYAISAKLSVMDSVSEKVSGIETSVANLVPLLETIVTAILEKIASPAATDNHEQVTQLESQVKKLSEEFNKAKEAEQIAISEWEKAEERSRLMEQERDEAKSALESVLMSKENVLSIAQELDQFVARLS